MPIGSSALSAECSQVRKICCALSAEYTPELTHLTALHNAVVHCVWSCPEGKVRHYHSAPWAMKLQIRHDTDSVYMTGKDIHLSYDQDQHTWRFRRRQKGGAGLVLNKSVN